MSGPQVSVVMANYNGGGYLPLAVESVLSQSYDDFEFIVVDDCSTDDSLAYLRSLDDPRIRLIENEQNRGQTVSLNIGLDAVTGRFVARMDADDICEPARFETQLRFLEQHSDIDICGTQARLIDESGSDRGVTLHPTDPDSIWAYSVLQNPFVHPSVFLRAELVSQSGVRFDERFINQDFELWSRLLPHHRGANLPERLIRYRAHTDSMTIRHHEENLRASAAIIRTRLVAEELDDLMTDEEIGALLRYVFADRRLADEVGVDRAALGSVLWRVTGALHRRRPDGREFLDLMLRRLVQSCIWPQGSRRLGLRGALLLRSLVAAPASWVRLIARTVGERGARRAVPTGDACGPDGAMPMNVR